MAGSEHLPPGLAFNPEITGIQSQSVTVKRNQTLEVICSQSNPELIYSHKIIPPVPITNQMVKLFIQGLAAIGTGCPIRFSWF